MRSDPLGIDRQHAFKRPYRAAAASVHGTRPTRESQHFNDAVLRASGAEAIRRTRCAKDRHDRCPDS